LGREGRARISPIVLNGGDQHNTCVVEKTGRVYMRELALAIVMREGGEGGKLCTTEKREERWFDGKDGLNVCRGVPSQTPPPPVDVGKERVYCREGNKEARPLPLGG